MIKTKDLLVNKNGKYKVTQRIIVICEDCYKEYGSTLLNQIKGIERYTRDLCVGCKQKEQIRLGQRGIQYINAGLASIKNMKGKTHIELYGTERAEEIRKINSDKNSGINNKNFGGIWHGIPPATLYKGKTYEEIYGKEKSDKIKKNLSIKFSGKNNNMFGKPSPNGSGNGWSGWYNDRFFRTLLELSFLIKYVDRFNMKCETAEKKEYRMEYIDFDSNTRNYFADYIINDKYMIEVKPNNLKNSFIVSRKKESALIFCKEHNLKYKIISPPRLKFKEIEFLVNTNRIELMDKYKEKYEIWKKNQTV